MGGDILVKVGADIGDYSRKMKEASSSLKDLAGTAQKPSLTLGKLAAGIGAVALATKGFSLVKNSFNDAFSRIDTMEQFERVMTTMTGSSEKAGQVLEAVTDTVTGTGYGLDVGAKAVQGFVTSSMDVNKATDTFAAWGDAVSFYGDGSNETMASVADAIAKMTAKGKVQMDTMNRLTEAGIPAMQIYADATGQSVEEVAEQMQKGSLDAEHFTDVMNDALMNGTENFGAIKGAAKEAGASWGASFDNMKAAVTRGTVAIVEAIDDMLTSNGLPDMREMVAQFGKKFEEVLKKVAEIIPQVAEKFKSIMDALEPIMPIIKAVIAGIGTFVTVVAIVNTVKNTFMALRLAVLMVNAAVLANPFALVLAVIAAVAVAVYYYWEPISEFFINLWNGIRDAGLLIWENLQEGWQNAKENLVEAWESVKEFFSELWEGVKDVTSAAWEGMGSIYTSAKETMESVWESTGDFFVGLWESISTIFSNAYSSIDTMTNGSLTNTVNFIKDIFTTASNILSDIWEFIKNTFSNALKFILALVTGDFAGMKNIIDNQMSNVKTLLSRIWDNIKSLIGDRLRQIVSDLKSRFSNMVSTTTSKGAEIVSAARTKFTEVKNAIKDKLVESVREVGTQIGKMPGKVIEFTGQMLSAGKGLITGLISGIKNMAGDAIEAITGVVDGVVNKAKSLLKINSPSKVFEQIGSWTGEGLVGGILSTVKSAQKASSKLVSAVIPEDIEHKTIDVSYNTPNDIKRTVSRSIAGNVSVDASGDRDVLERIWQELRSQKQMIVEMDGREVGRAVRPHVNEGNAIEAMTRRYF